MISCVFSCSKVKLWPEIATDYLEVIYDLNNYFCCWKNTHIQHKNMRKFREAIKRDEEEMRNDESMST
jgi:hypothetical protein